MMRAFAKSFDFSVFKKRLTEQLKIWWRIFNEAVF
jgi:hypothetical protein